MHKEIEVVNGDGSNLEISSVSDHLVDFKPKQNKIENVIIPEVKKVKDKEIVQKKEENDEEIQNENNEEKQDEV